MSNLKILFGKKIKELRKKSNFTQAQLAELVNVDNKHISCIESGKSFPSADLLYRMALSLNVEVKDLFEFYHLQNTINLKKEITQILEELSEEQILLTYKYIKTFVLK